MELKRFLNDITKKIDLMMELQRFFNIETKKVP